MDFQKLSNAARTLIWAVPMVIVGFSGIFAHHYNADGSGSPVASALEGDYDHAFHKAAMNYTGMDTYQNTSNGLKHLWERSLVPKLAIGVGVMLGVAKAIKSFLD